MDGPKLEWMYRNSNEIVDKEEYLLGKPIDKAFEHSQSLGFSEIEKDCLPTSIFANTGSSVQVDIFKKLKEDPLEVIRQQEIEKRKQLLRNPIKLKKLQNMLKNEEKNTDERRKDKYETKHEDIDALLASKYSKLMRKHGLKNFSELAQLKIDNKGKKHKKEKPENFRDSSNSQLNESKPHERKRKQSERGNSEERPGKFDRDKSKSDRGKRLRREQRRHHSNDSEREVKKEMQGSNKGKDYALHKVEKKSVEPYWKKNKSDKLSEKEKERRLKEMMENAKWRDEERTKNINRYKKEEALEGENKYSEDFMRQQMILATSQGTVESRIKSNINNVQRTKNSMEINFARR